MGRQPRNPARAEELWNEARIADQLAEIRRVRTLAVLSGGWAWHFLSPPDEELKVLHDHSDIDLFVQPTDVSTFLVLVESRGFERVKTKYDTNEFSRHVKHCEAGKVVIDAFVGQPPAVTARDGYRVVEPAHLLGLYDTTHQNDGCRAVVAARKLLGAEGRVLGHPSLIAP